MNWTNASTDASDIVLSQMVYEYDDNGNVILTADKERFDDDSTCSFGDLGNPFSGIGARVYYTANYYDAADRLIESRDASAPRFPDIHMFTRMARRSAARRRRMGHRTPSWTTR